MDQRIGTITVLTRLADIYGKVILTLYRRCRFGNRCVQPFAGGEAGRISPDRPLVNQRRDFERPQEPSTRIPRMRLIPRELDCSLVILKVPSSPIDSTCGPPQTSAEKSPII